MTWETNIKKVDNGYLVRLDNGETPIEAVFQINGDIEETKAEQLCMQDLFHTLLNFFGVNNDKHKNQYLTIEVSEGSEIIFPEETEPAEKCPKCGSEICECEGE